MTICRKIPARRIGFCKTSTHSQTMFLRNVRKSCTWLGITSTTETVSSISIDQRRQRSMHQALFIHTVFTSMFIPCQNDWSSPYLRHDCNTGRNSNYDLGWKNRSTNYLSWQDPQDWEGCRTPLEFFLESKSCELVANGLNVFEGLYDFNKVLPRAIMLFWTLEECVEESCRDSWTDTRPRSGAAKLGRACEKENTMTKRPVI